LSIVPPVVTTKIGGLGCAASGVTGLPGFPASVARQARG
jgi:hypothetical protein